MAISKVGACAARLYSNKTKLGTTSSFKYKNLI